MAVYKSKTATKDGRKWYFSVCYLTANSEKLRHKSKKFITRQETQEAERQFLIDKSQNRIDTTFEEVYYQYLEYIEESIKGSTKHCRQNRIKNQILPYFGKTNIHNITANAVIEWKTKINKATYNNGKKYALQYKQLLMSELRTVLNYGVNFCGLKENIANKVIMFHDKNEKVISDEEKVRYIIPAEYNLFASVIENIVYKTFFAFLYYMGVRKGEAQALTWEDILWDINKVRIIKTITNKTDELDKYGNRFKITNTKNRKNRLIKMPLTLKNMLLKLYQYYTSFEGFNEKWFIFGGYRYLSNQSIDRKRKYYFDLVKEKYGKEINRITNHEFRHSHASYLISQRIPIERIAFRLGDTVAVVEKVYAHLFPKVEDEVIEALDLIENNYKINVENNKLFMPFESVPKMYLKDF